MYKSKIHDLNDYCLGTSMEKCILQLSTSGSWLMFGTFLGDI